MLLALDGFEGAQARIELLPCGPGLLAVGVDVGGAQSLFQEQAAETVSLEGRIGFAFGEGLLEFGQAVVVAVTER
ncbi:hypothetical protein [Reyranella sp.]|uniref:hypothetical protein n=1 Tax=Reyranella sp. TaxID=1929291 RepID=UPI004035911D